MKVRYGASYLPGEIAPGLLGPRRRVEALLAGMRVTCAWESGPWVPAFAGMTEGLSDAKEELLEFLLVAGGVGVPSVGVGGVGVDGVGDEVGAEFG